MNFNYIGIKDGAEVHGSAEAADKFSLSRALKVQGITVLSAEIETARRRGLLEIFNKYFSTVSFKQKIFLVGNLSEMLKAGLSLARALKVSAKQTRNPKLAKVIGSITADIDKGGSFAGALVKFPGVFPPTTVAMVEAGEKSGRLPEALALVSTQMLKTYQLRKRIRGALTYPAIVIGAMIGIAIMMLVYIVPTLSATFRELGAELPLSTRLIVGFSDFLANHYLVFTGIILGLAGGSFYGSRLTAARRAFAWTLLRLPIFGNLTRQSNSALTARTLASLLHAGVEIVTALGITEKVLSNPYYKEVLTAAALAVPRGQSLSAIFGTPAHEKLYPPFVGEMLSVGEETGRLPEMLAKLAEFYENEVDAVVKDLSTVIEPLIMLLVGAGVGFFALSMIQPIYQVGSNI